MLSLRCITTARCVFVGLARVALAMPQVAQQFRGITADRLRAGNIIVVDGKNYRVVSNGRSQKGQTAAVFHAKLSEVGTGKLKEVSSTQGHDYVEARYERVRMLFSGFDENDMACFVYPQFSGDAGKEVNILATTLSETVQNFLAVRMPCELTHVFGEEGKEDVWSEVNIPTSYTYTVEKITAKGMQRMAYFFECDGCVSVPDNVQLNDKVKVIIRQDGTAAFHSKT